jgi:hypothetical protein
MFFFVAAVWIYLVNLFVFNCLSFFYTRCYYFQGGEEDQSEKVPDDDDEEEQSSPTTTTKNTLADARSEEEPEMVWNNAQYSRFTLLLCNNLHV